LKGTVAVRVTTNEADRTTKVESAPKLLVGIGGLSQMLDMSARTIRRKFSAGLIPKPLRLSGSIRWSVAEIRAWVEAGCPDRKTWEAMYKQET
jgi:predicted DNA-binding transcriptional regulator AlpA